MKLSVFCGLSVDGFLARPDDTFDFLNTGEQQPHGFTEFLATVDVVVMGRRTLEVVLKPWSRAASRRETSDRAEWPSD